MKSSRRRPRMPSLTMRKFSLSCSPLPQSVKSTSTQPSASRRNRADSRSRASAPSSPPVDSRAAFRLLILRVAHFPYALVPPAMEMV